MHATRGTRRPPGDRSALGALEHLHLTGEQIVRRAVDAIVQCNGCTADEALEILHSAGTHRNVGLEEVAATVLLALTGVEAQL